MQTQLYWIPGPWRGRVAIMPRPRGGDWLEDEIQAWRRAGVDIVLSLLTADEIGELHLLEEEAMCRAHGIEFCSFPIDDRAVPESRAPFLNLLTKLREELQGARKIAVHCRQGIGRAAMVAIGLLIVSGMTIETAIEGVAKARGVMVPETAEQRQWLALFAKTLPVETVL